MEKTALFSGFDPVSAKQWKQKIQVDLKGAEYNETLVWESLEDIKVKPFYNKEDLPNVPVFPLPKDHQWAIGQDIYVAAETEANAKALDVLNRGATSLVFGLHAATIDWDTLLKNIPLATTPIHLNFHQPGVESIKSLLAYTGEQKVQFFLHLDIIGHLAGKGNWYHKQEEDHQLLDQIFSMTNDKEGIIPLAINTALYQNAGANMVQQLAYGLAHANEYLNHVDQNNTAQKQKPMVFKVAIGPNYFFEIAKQKALRWLWASLAPNYGHTTQCHILASPSTRNKTIYDYNVNMLRTTSESMAAVLGGADTIVNLRYDAPYHKDNEFGERIARNQLLLLKEESYLDEAIHAAEGAYYIERLTVQLAEKALALFKQIEAAGGFIGELKKGIIQKKIKAAAAKEQALFDNGQLVLLGTNKYENPKDRMKDDLEISPFLKQNKRKTLIAPILERRLSENLDLKRLQDE